MWPQTFSVIQATLGYDRRVTIRRRLRRQMRRRLRAQVRLRRRRLHPRRSSLSGLDDALVRRDDKWRGAFGGRALYFGVRRPARRSVSADGKKLRQAAALQMLFRLTDVYKSYGAQDVLRGTSLQINPGEHAGLVGRNGAGKTTIFRLVTGDETP